MSVPATTETKDLAIAEATVSERFMLKVINEFGSGVGEVALTKFQKRLAQNYFMSIDSILKKAEAKRNKNKEQLPVIWQNVNMEDLARGVVAAARIGLDPMEKNHINPIPYKNNNTGKYDITFILGYFGIEIKAVKYGLDVPDVTVELVYSNDKFRSIKKDRNNKVESFDFEIVNDFDRGEIIGGFYYHDYPGRPEKNKLVVFTKKDIEKRKPKYASPEFWGGEKDTWENGKKAGKEQVEGWYERMAYKTIYRAAYGAIPIDSQKIDNDYMVLNQAEQSFAIEEPLAQLEADTSAHANQDYTDIQTGEITPQDNPATDKESLSVQAGATDQDYLQVGGDDGPGF